jgi:hypothetical protein
MVATVTIGEKNGVSGTYTNKTSDVVRMKNADNATVDPNNPMVIPGSGSDWSYEKWLRLKIGATGPSVQITNLKFYTDGTNGFGTGVSLWAKAVSTYATPAEGTASTGYADAFGYTSGSALSLGSGPYTATDTEIGDHCVLLLQVASTATQGSLTTETVTFSYDEI